MLSHVSGALQAASDEVHLHSPSEASQKGACRLEHASNVDVHLHILFAESQYSPLLSPAQDATVALHLHWLFSESQYCPLDFPLQVSAAPHLHSPLLLFAEL